jgi:hypothetical protein
MPFDEPVAEDQDLYRQAMRLGPPQGTCSCEPATNGQPMPQPVGAPPSVPDEALLRHAMSSGMKFSQPETAPEPPRIPVQPQPSVVRDITDRSTVEPIAPPSPETTLGQLKSQRARAGQPIDASDPKYKMGTGMRVLGTAGNFPLRASEAAIATRLMLGQAQPTISTSAIQPSRREPGQP